ncbi:MAG: hypothetical protein A2900_01855 [Candidatus Chisholmbacteria bacterium RIFCSPLOWO2_01_FULL_50_28]|nr:MAG: hypothetical protein A2900_01855 [Candidatus Chisholmbacteria bacterium RIFCSPLOWO2_01_FULL_50_28]
MAYDEHRAQRDGGEKHNMPTSVNQTYSGTLVAAWTDVTTRLLSFFPNLIAAIAVFLVGWIVAGWARAIIIKILDSLRLSNLIKDTGIQQFLKKADITVRIEETIGAIIKWLIILVFFIASVNILGLSTVSQVLESILGYIPNVISAALILTIGVLISGVVESLVKGAVGSVDVKAGRLLGKIASYTIVVFTALAAISELKIAQAFINTIFTGVIAMLALGFGLALGLGAKDLVSRFLTDWYERFRKDIE